MAHANRHGSECKFGAGYTYFRNEFQLADAYLSLRRSRGRTDLQGIAQVDALLSQLKETLVAVTEVFDRSQCTLRRFRNAYIAINTLPDELLSLIFETAANHNILTIIDTCARWRRVCLASPAIWSNFTVHRRPYYGNSRRLLNIARLAGHMLGITIFLPPPEPVSGVAELVRPMSHLIRRLTLRDWLSEDWFSRDYSRLKYLKVTGHVHRIIPHVLGRSDALEEMILYNCRFPYSPQYYRGLTTLFIAWPTLNFDGKSTHDPDESVFAVLRVCPDIQNLTLKGVHVPVIGFQEAFLESQVSNPMERIPLRRLRYLEVHLWSFALSAILQRVETSPTLTCIRLAAYGVDDALQPDLTSLMEQSFVNLDIPSSLPSLITARSCVITTECHNENVEELPRTAAFGDGTPCLAFFPYLYSSQSDPPMDSAWSNFFARARRDNALHSLHTLILHDRTRVVKQVLWTQNSLLALLRTAPSIHTLGIHMSAPIEHLQRIASARQASESTERVIPGLQTVILMEHWFGSQESITSLADVLRALHVRRLVLRPCAIRPALKISQLELGQQLMLVGGVDEVQCESTGARTSHSVDDDEDGW